jgi:hypothetical protein
MLLSEVYIVLDMLNRARLIISQMLHHAFSVQEQQEPPIGPLPSRTRDGRKGIRGQTWHVNNDAAGKHARTRVTHVALLDHLGGWCACMHD